MRNMSRYYIGVLLAGFLFFIPLANNQAFSEWIALEDFQHPDADGFPQGWEGSRSKVTAKEAYSIGRCKQ